ncbi:hypothetical protein F0562_022029 [Nyssa sinensis]|uniref:RING-type domain-containing protein n=1 Tax=Nyssa sinensis TaxID=561372 RepID=A0A5J5BM96_9ASTE|nr:hypothetical protein F0562_022029 [Nyssa sinensis]
MFNGWQSMFSLSFFPVQLILLTNYFRNISLCTVGVERQLIRVSMGFDNECILNIQSLAGEYFCPVCRLLVYPNEAFQSQCTHLYCKPCLKYIAGTTRACPYDGYLVTEADSKLLIESNKTLAETIGKIAVHCLYHRSGCTWQGPLSECTSHCSGCAFGNSPVVCNRCGIQIVHQSGTGACTNLSRCAASFTAGSRCPGLCSHRHHSCC